MLEFIVPVVSLQVLSILSIILFIIFPNVHFFNKLPLSYLYFIHVLIMK